MFKICNIKGVWYSLFLCVLGYDYKAHYNGHVDHMCQGYVHVTVCISDTIRYVQYTCVWWYIGSQVSDMSEQIILDNSFTNIVVHCRKNVSKCECKNVFANC